jgi:hypothetical protein
MKIVNELAVQVEAALRKDEIQVVREPYDPGSRNLLSDFVGFLRSPSLGSTVTLFEDDSGRVRYYTVAQVSPELAELRTQVADLTQAGGQELPTQRLDQLEKRLKKVEALDAKMAKVEELALIAERLPEVEAKVDAMPDLEAKIGELGELRTRLERLERPRPG